MRTKSILFLFALCAAVAACSPATPQKYFETAVLNTNMLTGFANSGMERELASPSIELQKDGSTAPMNRGQILEDKIRFTEDALSRIKALKVTDETREMLETSKLLHEYVLTAYKKDYRELARLYDQSAPDQEIALQAKAIREKYGPRAAELHQQLISLGKVYAAKHDLQVNWDIRTTPQ